MPPEALRTTWAERDRRWAVRVQRRAQRPALLWLLRAASRLGDGVVWYAAIAALALLGGTHGRDVAMQMTAVGAFNLLLYLWLKNRIGRPRPFVQCADIRACARALDRFSFPSGHALHATAFSLMLVAHLPWSAWAALPLAALVMLSRVALGLHYPSDVAAGAAIGALSAALMIGLY
jgi:undecaprenyl-diphosphatase